MPKLVDYEQKRRSIAEIAVSVFSKNSFESTTMHKIASEAGIAKGSIYKYFKSKEELLTYIIVTFLDGFEELISGMDSRPMQPLERLRLYLFEFIVAIKPFEELFLILIEIWPYNIKGEYAILKKRIEFYFRLYRRKITEIIKDAQNSGVFRKEIKAEIFAAYLAASLDGLLVHYFYDKSLHNLEEIAETFFEVITAGLIKN